MASGRVGRSRTLRSTKSSESGEKSRVLRITALVSAPCISPSDQSSLCLPVDSVVGRWSSYRISRSALNCTFFAASGRVDRGCLLSTAYLWVLRYRLWPRCLDAMVLVKPATVIQWHRQGFRAALADTFDRSSYANGTARLLSSASGVADWRSAIGGTHGPPRSILLTQISMNPATLPSLTLVHSEVSTPIGV